MAGRDISVTHVVLGTWSFKDGRWQRFYCDVDVTIDLEKVTSIHYICATFLSQRIQSVSLPAKVAGDYRDPAPGHSALPLDEIVVN